MGVRDCRALPFCPSSRRLAVKFYPQCYVIMAKLNTYLFVYPFFRLINKAYRTLASAHSLNFLKRPLRVLTKIDEKNSFNELELFTPSEGLTGLPLEELWRSIFPLLLIPFPRLRLSSILGWGFRRRNSSIAATINQTSFRTDCANTD